MKVILSINAVQYPLTGIGRYAYEIASRIGRIPGVQILRYFRQSRFCQSLPVEEDLPLPSSQHSGIRASLLKSRLALQLYSTISDYRQKRVLNKFPDFIYHGPNYDLPKFPGPSVATIHDISIFKYASCHPPERVCFMEKQIGLTIKRAFMLITDTEYTRNEISDYFSFPLDKICAVPLAASDSFYPRQKGDFNIFTKKYQLIPSGYCLFVGTIEPRKNIGGLLDAYEMLPMAKRRRYPLILSGHRGWRNDDLHARIRKAELQGWVRYLGFVPAEDLPLLFAGAKLFIFPSLYEGFGLPVLEAMASGVPVICSDSSSLPEVAGNAAAMCHALDVDRLGQLIEEGLENDQWRKSAVRKGLHQAQCFSWERCAKETVQVYRDVLSL